MFAYVENQRKFRKRGTANNTIFAVLIPDSGRPFSKVNDIRSHGCVAVRGSSQYVPRLSFKPFHSAVSEGSHVAVGISSKANDRKDICLQTLFLFLVLPQTPCFPPRAPRFPLDPVFPRDPVFSSRPRVAHSPSFPDSPHPVPLAPRFPPSRNGHDFIGGFALTAREKKDLLLCLVRI